MKVDIWSDVRCPFCYIGKHKFEKALQEFPQKEHIEVVWHSFELDPYIRTDAEKSIYDHLAENKGISRQQAEQMVSYSTRMAGEVGLKFNQERSVVANSFNAHRLIQFAKTKGLGDEVEERLFKAYFEEGKNIDDKEALAQIGVAIGLDKKEWEDLWSSDAFEKEVREDESAAQRIGIHGVPFFVFDQKYAVSGAQSPEVFSEALEQSWSEYEKKQNLVILEEGKSCSADGNCDL